MKISNFPISVDKKTCLKTHFFYPGKPSLATPQNIDFGNFGDKKWHICLDIKQEKKRNDLHGSLDDVGTALHDVVGKSLLKKRHCIRWM